MKQISMNRVGAIWNTDSSVDHVFALVLTFVLSLIFTAVLFFSNGEVRIITLYPLVVFLLFSLSNFKLSLLSTVVMLFVDITFKYSSAVWFSIPLSLSFVFSYRDIKWKEFSNPLNRPILIYGLSIIPSFLNTNEPLISLLMLYNVIAFLIVVYSIFVGIQSYDFLSKIVALYLAMVLLNSIDVFRLFMLGDKRPFGFASIWFVDYSALGVCIAVMLSLYVEGLKRFFLLSLSAVIAIALGLTQTRNTWLSAIITLGIVFSYLIVRPTVAGITRRRLFGFAAVGIVLLVVITALVVMVNPKIESRATEFAGNTEFGVNEQGMAQNSIVTRMFIWDTALNAFRAYPLTGIGVYTFRFSSQEYYKFPRVFYNRYVAKLTPHQTHLAVLAETGILGFIGFLIFIVSTLKISFRVVASARNGREKKYAVVVLTCIVYCTVSMIFTDAWLWGQQIILLGLVIGAMLTIRKINQLTDKPQVI